VLVVVTFVLPSDWLEERFFTLLAGKIVSEMRNNVSNGTLKPTIAYHNIM